MFQYSKAFTIQKIHHKSVENTDNIFLVRLFNRVFGFILMLFETNFIFVI